MNETGELLHGPAGSDSSQSSNSSSLMSPPLEGKRSSGHENKCHLTRETEKKKLKQKLMETKLFQRLMQPPYNMSSGRSRCGSRSASRGSGEDKVSGATYDYDAPRLGEVPARSKYNRPDQNKIHFSNHPTYLPLAEQCGPPQSSLFAKPTPRHKVNQNSKGHQEIEYNPHISPQGSAHLSYRHEDAIEDTQDDRQYPHITSRENIISTASSVGPTGLILVPQFRWAPKKNPSDPRCSTLKQFNFDHETCNKPMAHHGRERSPSKRVNSPNMTANYTRGESRHNATPQNHLHRPQEGPSPSLPHSSSTAFSPDLSPPAPARASGWSAAPQQKTGMLSFYGPIGTIGIKASRTRHILEGMCAEDGAVKHGYEGYCSHQHHQRIGTEIPLTQVWCDMNLLRDIPMIDSPCLSSDEEDGEEPATARVEAWSRSVEEKRVPDSSPSGTPQRTASYLLSDNERSLVDRDQMTAQEDMVHEVESPFSSSDDTDGRSNDTVSNSSEGSRTGSSSGSKSNDEYDIVDTSDDDILVRKNKRVSGDSTEPPRWGYSSPNTVTTEMGLSVLGYGDYEFMHSPLLYGSSISRRPNHAAISRICVGNDDDTRRARAAESAHIALNDSPLHVNAPSAEMLATIMTPLRQDSPIAFPRAMKQHHRTPDTVTRNAILEPVRSETPTSHTVARPRSIARATDTHPPNTPTPQRTMRRPSSAVSHGNNDSVCTPSPRLGERFIHANVRSSRTQRHPNRTTPGDDDGRVPESVSANGCGAARVPTTRTSRKHSLTAKHNETSVEKIYTHNSPSISLPHSPLQTSVRGPKMLTKSGARTAADKSNTPSRLPPLQLIDRRVVSPSPLHLPGNTVQNMYSPLLLASPPRLPQTDRKNVFPGVT